MLTFFCPGDCGRSVASIALWHPPALCGQRPCTNAGEPAPLASLAEKEKQSVPACETAQENALGKLESNLKGVRKAAVKITKEALTFIFAQVRTGVNNKN